MVRAPRSLIDVVGLGILALGALLWFDTFPFDRGQEGARRPASAAGFDFDGKPVELSQWSGRILVVNFWATWCEPCRREVPDLVALQNEYPIATLVVVGIAVDLTCLPILGPAEA
jgi:thiol-disulfide isomerase/thioredoxin